MIFAVEKLAKIIARPRPLSSTATRLSTHREPFSTSATVSVRGCPEDAFEPAGASEPRPRGLSGKPYRPRIFVSAVGDSSSLASEPIGAVRLTEIPVPPPAAAKVYVGTEIAIGLGLGLVAGAVWKVR